MGLEMRFFGAAWETPPPKVGGLGVVQQPRSLPEARVFARLSSVLEGAQFTVLRPSAERAQGGGLFKTVTSKLLATASLSAKRR